MPQALSHQGELRKYIPLGGQEILSLGIPEIAKDLKYSSLRNLEIGDG
jgi:hypothetical protein